LKDLAVDVISHRIIKLNRTDYRQNADQHIQIGHLPVAVPPPTAGLFEWYVNEDNTDLQLNWEVKSFESISMSGCGQRTFLKCDLQRPWQPSFPKVDTKLTGEN